MVTLSPMVSPAGPPPCSTQLSSTLTLLPMRIGPKSALMTAPGQTVELGPISTSPMTVALMAMKQLGSILGVLPRKGQIIHNLQGVGLRYGNKSAPGRPSARLLGADGTQTTRRLRSSVD